jgi:transcriptional regulator with XRE-family HTH domain
MRPEITDNAKEARKNTIARKTLQTQQAVGRKIRRLRSDKNFTQEAFADHCGIHRSFMGQIERGESNLCISTLVALAEGLELDFTTLVGTLD